MKITNKLKVMLKHMLSVRLGEVATDNGTLYWDGEGDLEQGMEVFIKEDDEFIAAPDGSYKLEDGKTVIVVDGVVSEIQDPEAEVAPEEPAQEPEQMAEEPAEEPAPADEPENNEPEASLEDRVAALEAKNEEFISAMNEIVNALAALEGRLAEVEAKLASVEAPAAAPVDEEPRVEEKQSRLSYLKKK